MHNNNVERHHLKPLKVALASLALAGSALAFPVTVLAQDGEVVQIRMQRYTGTEEDAIFQRYKDMLAEASDGRIQLSIFRGGELVPNDQMFTTLRSGTLQAIYGYGGYWGGQMDTGVLESGIPMAWTSLEEAKELWNERGLGELLAENYARQGIHYTVPVFGGKFDLLTKEPVESLADMSELKIRATPSVAAVLEHFDIPTVYIPPQEFYIALSTNTIDGLIYGGPYDYSVLKLDEVATHYTEMNMLYPGFVDNVLVNQRFWDQMPEDLQQIFTEVTAEWADYRHQKFVDWNEEAAHRFDITRLPEDDILAMTEAAQDVWDTEAEKSPVAAEAIEMIRQMARDKGRLD
ncbi:TRAP transporter substrate-binding protein DctP [Halomonas organivorans]|uniref:TRAP-type C4-dicarboxylate transport system substrate-binding protein n=1 Tax=Halomonas organivorans TaxID=257772 RepID=A0A7W5BXC6_9GAMM|nr:TRAP transporter substrate-binding protein DctP [Halomonas organivorans]MBB3140819.1 TRAP-type C4-dicarboxylate transport system substrate-binding protein [Halomonas organivorans]